MQEFVRDVHAVRADEFGDWRARVLCCVGFFTLLLIAVIAARWLSCAAAQRENKFLAENNKALSIRRA